jgi:hypothetical protein
MVYPPPGCYRSGSYSQDTLSIHPYKLDCGVHAADGLDNSFQIYIAAYWKIHISSIGALKYLHTFSPKKNIACNALVNLNVFQ